ncbi:hypothetical protein I9G02_004510 [Salmonella enterica]|nr:hypothetical protein [Salmonella enterica]EKE2606144.1 hypothetical protein [Salmonella enterica]
MQQRQQERLLHRQHFLCPLGGLTDVIQRVRRATGQPEVSPVSVGMTGKGHRFGIFCYQIEQVLPCSWLQQESLVG